MNQPTSAWPTTTGMAATLDPDAVRRHFQDCVTIDWGERVDARMDELGLRNVQVAVLAGTTPQTISKVRKGEMAPRDYLRVTIAAALGTTTDALFPMPSPIAVASKLAPGKTRRRTKAAA